MIKIKITLVIVAISIFGLVVNSAGIAIPNAQATSNDANMTQSSDDNTQSSNDNTQTFDDSNNSRYLEVGGKSFYYFIGSNPQTSDAGNNVQTSDGGNKSTSQKLLPSSPMIFRFEETPLQTLSLSEKDINNPDIKSELNQMVAKSQNDLSQKDVQQLKQSEMPAKPEEPTMECTYTKDADGNEWGTCSPIADKVIKYDDKTSHIGRLFLCGETELKIIDCKFKN